MSIAPGSQLGPYEILSPLGAGGMGEVYKARDTRLDRTVAVKVLPEHLSQDPARRERFEREAQAVSSLNHPHICTLHDVGEHEGVHFLVMEHIEGDTLADRLKKGPLPFELALEYAAQIADALDRAHSKGIVHRDLKPGNVMLTKPGVKLLDFGLAKASPTRRSLGDGGPDAPTQQKPLTDASTIVGTVQYMAPEQLEGKEVDARADLFALGAVLFEMLTGNKAFYGESQASLISAIMSTEPPPVSELQALSPPAMDRIVSKCLAKDRTERWQTARDLMDELRWIASETTIAPAQATADRMKVVPWLVAAAAVVGAILLVGEDDRSSPPNGVVRFSVDLAGHNMNRAPSTIVSPDGQHLVFRSSFPNQLNIRSLSALETRVIPGTEGVFHTPFFSPDGEWLAFVVGTRLQKVALAGGQSQNIGTVAPGFVSGTWSKHDEILFSTSSALYTISATGGEPELVIESDTTNRVFPNLQWLPDGRRALVTSYESLYQTSIFVLDVATGERRELIQGGAQAHYVDSGHLVYRNPPTASMTSIVAAAFNPARAELLSDPVTLPDAAWGPSTTTGGGFFHVSNNGTLVLVPPNTTAQVSLVWVDELGATTPLDAEPGVFRRPALSPNGTRLAVARHPEGTDIHDVWLYNLDTGGRSRFTVEGHNASPVWAPDGKTIAFASRRPAPTDKQRLYSKPADGGGEAKLLVELENEIYPVSWSPDGTKLAFVETDPGARENIWILALDGNPVPMHVGPFNEHSPMFSPDGNFIAYVSDESGVEEVYVAPFPSDGAKHVVSTSGGKEPIWSHDGRKLYFRGLDDSKMFVVSVELEPTVTTSRPQLLFSRLFFADAARKPTFARNRDGRFLMVEEIGDTFRDRVIVVLNFAEELKRLVPAE